jgi:hypothetical protein
MYPPVATDGQTTGVDVIAASIRLATVASARVALGVKIVAVLDFRVEDVEVVEVGVTVGSTTAV